MFNNVFGYISKVFFKMLKLFKNINLKLKKSSLKTQLNQNAEHPKEEEKKCH